MDRDTDVLAHYIIHLLDRTLSDVALRRSTIGLVCFVVLFLTGAAAAACNIFMFAVIASRPALRRRPVNLLILASCASDAVGSLAVPLVYFGVGAIPLESVRTERGETAILTQASDYVATFTMTNTNLLLLLLVTSRYRGIMHPLTAQPYSYKCTALAIACAQVVSAVSTTAQYLFQELYASYARICLVFSVPMMAMTVMVCRMYRELSTTTTPGLLGQAAWAQRARSRRMILLLYVSYLLTSLPLLLSITTGIIVLVFDLTDSISFVVNSIILLAFVHLLLFLNGFVNLIIYTTMCKDVGDAVSASLACLTKFSNSTRVSGCNVRDERV